MYCKKGLVDLDAEVEATRWEAVDAVVPVIDLSGAGSVAMNTMSRSKSLESIWSE